MPAALHPRCLEQGRSWLEQYSQRVQSTRNALDTWSYATWDFLVADGGPLEVAYAGPGRLFLFSIRYPCHRPDALSDKERKQLRPYLGVIPQQQWNLSAMSNAPLADFI